MRLRVKRELQYLFTRKGKGSVFNMFNITDYLNSKISTEEIGFYAKLSLALFPIQFCKKGIQISWSLFETRKSRKQRQKGCGFVVVAACLNRLFTVKTARAPGESREGEASVLSGCCRQRDN